MPRLQLVFLMDKRTGPLLLVRNWTRNWMRRKSHVQFYGTKVQSVRTHVQFYSSDGTSEVNPEKNQESDGTSEANPEKNQESELISLRIKYTHGKDGMGFLNDCKRPRPIYVKKGCTMAHRNCLLVDHPNHLRCILFDVEAGHLICHRPDKTLAQYIEYINFYGVLPTHPKFWGPKPVTRIHPVCRNVIRQMVRYLVDMHNIYPELGALMKFNTHDIFMQDNTVKYAAVPFAGERSTPASLEANIMCVLEVIKELFGEGPFPKDLTHFFDKMRAGNYNYSGKDLLDHPSIASGGHT